MATFPRNTPIGPSLTAKLITLIVAGGVMAGTLIMAAAIFASQRDTIAAKGDRIVPGPKAVRVIPLAPAPPPPPPQYVAPPLIPAPVQPAELVLPSPEAAAKPPPPPPRAERNICTAHGLQKVWVNGRSWRCRR
jgi:hypothetical protein